MHSEEPRSVVIDGGGGIYRLSEQVNPNLRRECLGDVGGVRDQVEPVRRRVDVHPSVSGGARA